MSKQGENSWELSAPGPGDVMEPGPYAYKLKFTRIDADTMKEEYRVDFDFSSESEGERIWKREKSVTKDD